ncbi:MAG TPA: ABC transporter ATP-binding protein [Pseudorhodoplanes sp.]|jgi:iron complex transport system ATP-binding protein|nr:ABC transporter ATP-binding protein [Pseudorhodoplanes sp.]
MSAILRADDISVSLGARRIVERARVKLRRGELAVLIGPNGAGKTTLIRALAGLLPAQGRIALEDKPLSHFDPRERARRIAYLPQGNTFHWPMTVAAVVALGRYPHGDPFASPTEEDKTAVCDALAATATTPFSERPVTALSGGERARVALARALATRAPVLLADEPIVSLDARHQLVVMNVLRDTARKGAAVLAVLHDLALAARFADHVLLMQDGQIVTQGEVKDVLTETRIAQVFGVAAQMTETGGARVPLPYRAL